MAKRVLRAFPVQARDGRPALIREARSSDAKRCLQITLEVAKERPRTLAVSEGEIWGPRQWRDHRLAWCPAGVTLVAELDREVVGGLHIMRGGRRATAHAAEFGIYLAPTARGLGLGRALIETAEIWAAESGVTRVHLGTFSTNGRARALYEGCGYEVEGIERAGMMLPEGPVDMIKMAKRIPPSR